MIWYNRPMNKHTIIIGINGIYCEHCIQTIEKTLSALPGVRDVRIRNNIARHPLSVFFASRHYIPIQFTATSTPQYNPQQRLSPRGSPHRSYSDTACQTPERKPEESQVPAPSLPLPPVSFPADMRFRRA